MKTWLFLLALLAGCASAPPAPPSPYREVRPGLEYAVLTPLPDSAVHVLRVDLARLRPVLSPRAERGKPMDQMDSVNASYFTKVFAVRGITISDGQAWAPVTSIAQSPLLACEAGPRCVIELHPTEPKPEWQMAVAGTPWLLDQGKQRTLEDDVACKAHCTTTHPRTAVGLTRDGRMLLIVLAEGRRPPVLGLTTQQLSKVMADLGAWDAVNLDGGGSSTLIVDGASLMGRPFNEPKLRAVANAINLVPR